jgi:hypothetical protein
MAIQRIKGTVFESSENFFVENITALKALPDSEREGVVILEGHTTANDGGGGAFYYDPDLSRVGADDDGTVIDPTGTGIGTGCWVRIYDLSQGTIAWWGADPSLVGSLTANRGIEGLKVFITDPTLGGNFIYNSATPDNPPLCYNGWVRVNDTEFQADLNLNSNKITNVATSIAGTDAINQDELTAAVAAIPSTSVTQDQGAQSATLAQWFGSASDLINVQTPNTTTYKTIGLRFEDSIQYFDTNAAMQAGSGLYQDYSVVGTRGGAAIGDGDSGVYVIKSAAQATTDGDTLGTPNIYISATNQWAILQKSDDREVQEAEVVLTDGQLVVDFGTPVAGNAVYVAGPGIDRGRLKESVDYTITDTNEITLTESYPAGTEVSLYWNELVSSAVFENTIQNVSANTDVDVTKSIVQVDCSGGAITALRFTTASITSGTLWEVFIKDSTGNAGTNNITLTTEGAETIDGSATYVLSTDWEGAIIYTDGTNLFVK